MDGLRDLVAESSASKDCKRFLISFVVSYIISVWTLEDYHPVEPKVMNLPTDFKHWWATSIIDWSINLCSHRCESKQTVILSYFFHESLAWCTATKVSQWCQRLRTWSVRRYRNLAILTAPIVYNVLTSTCTTDPLAVPEYRATMTPLQVSKAMIGAFSVRSCHGLEEILPWLSSIEKIAKTKRANERKQTTCTF
jgi:hypothetical protein